MTLAKPATLILRDNMWQGLPCFIIGGGLSLQGFDFERLRGRPVIACNRAYECGIASLIVASDRGFWPRFSEALTNLVLPGQQLRRLRADGKCLPEELWQPPFLGPLAPEHSRRTTPGREQTASSTTPVQTGKSKPEDFYTPAEPLLVYTNGTDACDMPGNVDVYRVETQRVEEWSTELARGVAAAADTGCRAINLACLLGCSPVYLLGFDMRGEGGRTINWHPGYHRRQPDSVYTRFAKWHERIAPYCRDRVVNLGPDSTLTCYPKAEFACLGL